MHAHHEAICTHAVSPPLSYPELPHPMVERFSLCQCLQRDVHLRVDLFLLAYLSSMVRIPSVMFLNDQTDIV